MKSLQITKAGGVYAIAEAEKPKPGPNQILLKSIVTAMNPVDTYMQSSGLLVVDWPIALGADAGGRVEEVGSDVKDFKVGDDVFGCVNCGHKGHGTFQEYFLMDAPLAVKKPDNVTLEQACCLGGSSYTACLGLTGLGVTLPDTPQPAGEWIIILGGGGSVGQAAIQVAKISGFKVLASCSARTADVATMAGADATFDYRASHDEQLAKIKEITEGHFSRVFDTVAQPLDVQMRMLTEVSEMGNKRFSTTDDWTPKTAPEGVVIDQIELAYIGRPKEELKQSGVREDLNEVIADFVPKIRSYVASGALKPQEYKIVGDKPGLEGLIDGIKAQQAGGSAGKKIVVRIADE